MPTYNRPELLKRAVESVLNQDYKNIELIIVDDRSTDHTPDYLMQISQEDSRVKYFINKENSGACVSRNRAIFAAKGEFITGLDDDDYFLPNHISSLVHFWMKNKDDNIALYTNVYVQKKKKKVKIKKLNTCKYKDLLCGNWIGNQLFTRTAYLQNINGFDESLPAWQDLECWYRLLKYYDSEARLVSNYSYLVDISHPHERITSNKIDSIFEAYKYFCNKHNLNEFEREVLKVQFLYYTGDFPSFKSVFKSALLLPNLHNFKGLIKMQLRPIWNKIRSS
ncbi:glycosyltransferase [Psychrobacter sanguinis]|nr:glycosyltransferase [Psychrobacter sanguinis]EGK13935.1 colanic acid gylcosyltransferase [Psychrobacter sp. 1501(2011)]MCD9150524.1 glycosyltransferase [Psychrobacter sanguinis]